MFFGKSSLFLSLVLICSLFFSEFQCVQYVSAKYYFDQNCAEEFSVAVFFSYTGVCVTSQFDPNEMLYYKFLEGERIEVIIYDGACINEVDRKIFQIHQCVSISKGLYANFSMVESDSKIFPFDPKEADSWGIIQHFSDTECKEPLTILNSILGTVPSVNGGGPEAVNLDPVPSMIQFCTNQSLYKRYPNGWNMFPRKYEGECLNMNKTRNSSLRFNCTTLNKVEDEFLSKFPSTPSSSKYFSEGLSYHRDCTSMYEAYSIELGSCNIESYVIGSFFSLDIRDNDRNIYQKQFLNENCDGPVIGFSIYSLRVYYNNTFDVCEYYSQDTIDPDLPIYYNRLASNEPFYDGISDGLATVGLQMDYICTDFDHQMRELKKNYYKYSAITYNDPDECIILSGINGVLSDRLSVRASCQNGIVKGAFFAGSNKCSGVHEQFDSSEEYICGNRNSSRVFFPICISPFCGDFNKYEVGVCSNHGACHTRDSCECDTNYKGNLCQFWKCYGTSHDHSNVCSGNGKCISHDDCRCDNHYAGIKCSVNINSLTIGVSVASASIILLACCICLLLFCSLLCCCIVGSVLCILCSCGFSLLGISLSQKKKLNKFEKLEDFDIIYQEQIHDKDKSIAHLRFKKSLFVIPYEEIKIIKMIGKGGADAIVFLANWKGNKVAFKCFKTKKLCSTKQKFEQFEREVNLLININHPNIIQCFGASMKPPRVGIVMEYCEKGELLDFILKFREEHGAGYPIKEKIRMCMEIISAVEFIHSRSIVHRDIKPANILINETSTCKLMDFGISRILESEENKLTKRIGTSIYMAPEILTGQYDEKVDTFSFGILLWVLFSENEYPYGESDFKIEFKVANDPEFRPDPEKYILLPGDDDDGIKYVWIKNVMKRCWKVDPEERYNFTELSNIFIKNSSEEKIEDEQIVERVDRKEYTAIQ